MRTKAERNLVPQRERELKNTTSKASGRARGRTRLEWRPSGVLLAMVIRNGVISQEVTPIPRRGKATLCTSMRSIASASQ
jgi:hypothetical protein